MSPRAAWRLESVGFHQVFDYVAGKADWFAAGLPREGERAEVLRAGDIARRDTPTCRLSERLGAVEERVRASGGDTCIVVNDQQVVLGRVRLGRGAADPEKLVETIMESGPTAFRPDVPLEELAEHMRQRRVGRILVTTAEGELIGLLDRKDAERT